MPDHPTISVVTATRNRPGLLRCALETVSRQEGVDYEAVILDDGSDASVQAEYERLFADFPAHFRLHRLRPPGSAGAGPGAARNEGIRRARGEFIAFLDDDDHWIRPDHLAVAVRMLREHGADYFFANMVATRGGEVRIRDWFDDSKALTSGPRLSQQPEVYDVPLRSFVRVMRQYLSHPDCWVVSRELLERVGGFWEKARFAEDYELMMRVADAARRILYRPDCVACYRLPEGACNSLAFTKFEETTQWILCTLHARATCGQRIVRRCARARESWALREIALQLVTDGRPGAALPFAWQGLTTFPTFGGAYAAARTACEAMASALKSRTRGVAPR
jgi:GT2 family glycosyltransferase